MLPVSRVVPAVARATWTPTKALPARASSATMVRMRVLMPNSVLDTEDDEGMEPAAGPAGVDEARDASGMRAECETRRSCWNLTGAATTSPHIALGATNCEVSVLA